MPLTTQESHRGRVRGSLLAGAVGDALGAPIEFDSIAAVRRLYGEAGLTTLVHGWRSTVGLITDDTQMTLFTAEGLIRARVRRAVKGDGDEVSAVRDAYLRWLDTQSHRSPPAGGRRGGGWLREEGWLYSRRAPGNACLSGLRHPAASGASGAFGALGVAGPVNPGSKGCGTVMRSAPFGFTASDPGHAFELSARCAQITHGHPTGYLAAGAFAAMIWHLAEGLAVEPAVREAMGLLRAYPRHEETTAALEAALALTARGTPTPERVESLGGAWVAEEALAIAVYCALAGRPEEDGPAGMRRALLLSVNHSGDSDSTGAVCGNLLGARLGEAALPADWLAPLEGRVPITALADDLAALRTVADETLTTWQDRYPAA
ncbi:hypothetical protein Misp01_28270 [Microtetraspora sp. NBRC 13810]|uniref:ADP-ribosylglycohydrolase family protein n=1 Tax=Microtetraspora sp. NBRC 13810 TaxID=3030990 RepID=UPI0024A4A52B|nr:ADP-ribosylglycohydrolase family protein [Microtetraspora sp. NBRC 13810]GLW07697.1 hypothetical protein Misp01_28270 [Microtetraspora sp. NBRC 13810]